MGFLSSLKDSVSKKQKAPGTSVAVRDRIKRILAINELEIVPVHALRAFQLASNPQAGTSDFVSVIESDEALGARIIRIANSVYFYRGVQAKNIETAVANIGLQELRCLLSATMLRSLLKGKHPIREQIWGNSVATAIAARMLSRYSQPISESEAFLAGLLHDVGKLIMIRKNPELYKKVSDTWCSGGNIIELEEEAFELNHVEVGTWIGEAWSFPKLVIEGIHGHHNSWESFKGQTGEGVEIAKLVKFADILSHSAGIGHPIASRGIKRNFKRELPAALKVFGLPEEQTETLLSELVKMFEEESSNYDGQQS